MIANVEPIHPLHEQLVADLQEYLTAIGRSARWLGFQVANDPRLVPNLKRGQCYPPAIMLELNLRLLNFFQQQPDDEPVDLPLVA